MRFARACDGAASMGTAPPLGGDDAEVGTSRAPERGGWEPIRPRLSVLGCPLLGRGRRVRPGKAHRGAPRSQPPAQARCATVRAVSENGGEDIIVGVDYFGEPPPVEVVCRHLKRSTALRQPVSFEEPRSGLQRLAIAVIRFYQRDLSQRLNRVCGYEPSCSEYAILAIAHQGLPGGVISTAKRLRRCRPSRNGEVDYPQGVPHVPR